MTSSRAFPGRLFMISVLVFAVVFSTASTTSGAAKPQLDTNTILARAEMAYYEARFADAIELLLPLDGRLKDQPQRLREAVRTKMQLALSHVGLNQLATAKAFFAELYQLDPQFSLDENKYARKVVALFEEARAAIDETRCSEICARASNPKSAQSAVANPANGPLLVPATCGCVPVKNINGADIIYDEGVQAYKGDNMPEALTKMRSVLALDPQNALAAEYVVLIDKRLTISIEQATLDWFARFRTGDFPRAAETYRRLLSMNLEGRASASLDQIRGEYRKAAAEKRESWTHACDAQDQALMESIRKSVSELIPDTSIAADIVDGMNRCAVQRAPVMPPVSAPVPAAPPVTNPPVSVPPQTETLLESGCIENSSDVALIRLKSRVEPRLPPELRGKGNVRVRVTVKINEIGNTRVYQVHGGSMPVTRAVVTAVDQWKFYPATYNDRPICVETVLPVVVNR